MNEFEKRLIQQVHTTYGNDIEKPLVVESLIYDAIWGLGLGTQKVLVLIKILTDSFFITPTRIM